MGKDALEENKPIIYDRVRCPHCNSQETSVEGTKLPIRYHRCHKCSKTFKSIQKT